MRSVRPGVRCTLRRGERYLLAPIALSAALGLFLSPIETAAITTGGVATASSSYGGNPPSAAFDGDWVVNGWGCNGVLPAWLLYEFNTPKIVTNYAFIFSGHDQVNNWTGCEPKTWTFEASNDGSNWTNLDTQTSVTIIDNVWTNFRIGNATLYSQYRINITACAGLQGPYVGITELELSYTAGLSLPPVISNIAALSITADSAALVGYLASTAGAPTTVYCFWGPTNGGTDKAAWATNDCLNLKDIGFLTNTLSGLALSTRYFYSFYASNATADGWAGSSASFSTLGPPVVNNDGGATNVGVSSATLRGEVIGGNPTPTAYIYWDTTPHGTVKSDWLVTGHAIAIGPATDWTFSASIPVTLGQTYYYRCYASNSLGQDAWAPATTNFTVRPSRYVDAVNGSDANDGRSWGSAFQTLTNALANAASNDLIWVAAGIYSPGPNVTDAFLPKSGVTVYGGFTNGGTMADRNWTTNPTVLEGSNVNYHVVRCVSRNGVVLDGLTIRGGYASGTSGIEGDGGGMLVDSSSFSLNNCMFTGNVANGTAEGAGGGLYVANTSFGVASNCTFVANSCNRFGGSWTGGGAGLSLTGSGTMLFKKCLFKENTAFDGGGLFVMGPGTTVADCDFIGNSSTYYAGAVSVYSGYTATPFINCTFVSNTAANYHGGGVAALYHTALLVNCSFSRNSAPGVSGHGGAVSAYLEGGAGSIIATNCIFWGDPATGLDEIYLGPGTATADYCDVQGGFAGTSNIDVNPLFANAPSDLHLQSAYGRWTPGGWVTDAQSSPCIDAGNPTMDYSREPPYNGKRINMGAYGNTAQASKSLAHSGMLLQLR